jgi:hypothetical protein
VLAMEKVLHREKRRAEERGNETRMEVTGKEECKRKREGKARAERRRRERGSGWVTKRVSEGRWRGGGGE